MALDCWGRLEVMGHLSFVGKLSEEEIAGALMIRVDYVQGEVTKTRYFGAAAIYGIEPMSEEETLALSRPRALPPTTVLEWQEPSDDFENDDDDADADEPY